MCTVREQPVTLLSAGAASDVAGELGVLGAGVALHFSRACSGCLPFSQALLKTL